VNNDAVIGVDVGSSASRAIALDRDGRVVAMSEAEHPDPGLPVGEADPEVWRQGLIAAVSTLGVAPAALGVGGHGPTTVAASGAGAITFRHTPSAADGLALQPLAQARVLAERHGAAAAPRQLWDWMITRLGGDSGFQSVWPGLQPLAGFGDAIAVGSVAGTTSEGGGLPPGIPLVPGCHDALLTAWSSGIDTAGKGFDPGGATGGLGVAVAAPLRDAELAGASLPAAVDGLVIVGGPVAAHGSMMSWWEQVTGADMDALIAAAAAVPPGSHGVMVLPFFEGERAPRWNPDLRAAIFGLHLDHGAEVITRAMLEAAAFGLAHIARDLAFRGVALDRVVASGRPARTPLLNAIKAAVLEVPLDIPDCEQMAAYGAALAAGAGIGWWPRPGEGGPGSWPIPAMSTVEPEPLPVYREAVDRFIALGNEAEARLRQ
jgi:sugar (pentulose or hexulose) kinase